jgi:hypothetical protein
MEEDDVEILKPAQRDQKGRLLPGQRSINPKGRPPIIRDIQAAAKQHTRAALNVLIKCMNDCEAPVSARIQAAEAILNRGWGRPQQNVEARIEVTDIAKTHAEVLMELSRRAIEEKQSRIAEQVIDVTPQRLPVGLSG